MASPLRNACLLLGCVVILAAAGLRLFDLGGKVIHADESVQAWKTGELLERGEYRYDPEDHHGPTLYYLAAAASWLAGERSVAELSIARLRLVPAITGTALVALTLALGSAIGWRAAWFAAAFTAVSPLVVYYSRHFIQESLLILFSAGTILAGWHWLNSRQLRWAATTGGCFGLMIATKETWLLAAFAMGVGWIVMRRGMPVPGTKLSGPSAGQSVVAAATAALVALVFYSSFFTRPDALVDVGHGIISGIRRAGDGGHAKPWYTYLSLLTWSTRAPIHWSEAGILLLALGAIPAIRVQPMPRFLAVYAAALLIAYSIIPYKTPWLACGFWHAFAILAGCGAARLLGAQQPHAVRTVAGILIVLLLTHLGWQAHRAAGPLAGNSRNPYGYVETSRDILRLPERLDAIATVHPRGRNMDIIVAAPQPWPLPWFLRPYPNVRYDRNESNAWDADVLLVSPEIIATLPSQQQEGLGTEFFGLRDGELVVLAVEQTLWEASLEGAGARP